MQGVSDVRMLDISGLGTDCAEADSLERVWLKFLMAGASREVVAAWSIQVQLMKASCVILRNLGFDLKAQACRLRF